MIEIPWQFVGLLFLAGVTLGMNIGLYLTVYALKEGG